MRYFFIQSKVRRKPIVTGLPTISRALRQLHGLTSSFDWFIGLPASFVISWSDNFGFGFTILNWKSPYTVFQSE